MGYRDKWWYYWGLDWSDIVRHCLKRQYTSNQVKKHLFTITNNQNMECFEKIVQLLPDYEFNVTARAKMGWQLLRMAQYPNVHLT
jgi:hypothetical protein